MSLGASRQPLSTTIADEIRAEIERGDLLPGERLVAQRLADQFGVSQIPIREALARLEDEGVVTREPRRGARVAEVTSRDLDEIASLRIHLEQLVIARAIANWTPEATSRLEAIVAEMAAAARDGDVETSVDCERRFHEELWTVAHHRLLQEVAGELRGRVNRFIRAATAALSQPALERHADDHRRLAAIVAAGDAAAAQAAMSTHIARATQRIKHLVVERGDTTGPNGEASTPTRKVRLTEAQLQQLRAGSYTAAMVWHGNETNDALTRAFRARLAELNIEVVAETSAGFDDAQQLRDIETALASSPDVIVSLPLDPVDSAAMFRRAIELGTKLVFLSNIPKGFKHGKDYVGVVSVDVRQAARRAAHLLAASLEDKGKLGLIVYDHDFFITNQWDDAYRDVLRSEWPGIEIVAEQGFADPAHVEEVASAMLDRHPELDAIYVTWDEPAVQVLSVLRARDRRDVKISTLGISEAIALELLTGDQIAGVAVENTVEWGRAVADVTALAALDEQVPAFLTAGSIGITEENVVEGWREVYGSDPPQAVLDASATALSAA